jgi:hypothetical protein
MLSPLDAWQQAVAAAQPQVQVCRFSVPGLLSGPAAAYCCSYHDGGIHIRRRQMQGTYRTSMIATSSAGGAAAV